ncbi:ATP-binding protein [Cerasicoccus arenae]|uniref:ATP-binding protein n=1 Tax=Cerasicoccus arenae TaxID=424488 RepID=UPI00167A4493|nr:transporter substrate-binding domain-containing protein [Cerasicoccus arenae]MBK1857906.1 transporter substrate-binding domain-containing protein [Cerasicoccus arenae]
MLLSVSCGLITSVWAQPEPQVDVLAEKNVDSTHPTFSQEEIDWIKQHPRISVGADTHFPPFEFLNNDNKIVGLAIAYLDLISEETGIKFDIRSSSRWQDLMAKAEKGDIGLLSGAVATHTRREKLYFSKPYAAFPSVIATRDDAHFVGSLSNLVGKKVAVVEGFFEEDILRRDYPELTVVTYPSRREALYAVSTKEAFAYIGNLAIISYLIRSENFDNVQIAAPTPFNRIGLSMAAKDPILISIIDKVLTNVSPEKQNSLEQNWIAVRYQNVEYLIFGKVGVGLLAIVLLSLAWIYSLKRQIKKRKISEEELSLAKSFAENAKAQAETAKARAEDANSRKSEFLGIAAHDLKNPLGSIRGLSELMLEDLQNTSLPESQLKESIETLDTIRDAADHMLELVKELLDVEALESGIGQNDEEYVMLNTVLEDVVDFNRHAAEKKSIDMKYNCSVKNPVTHGDLGRIREILDNLVNNAVKYTQPKGQILVLLDFMEHNKMLRVTVEDEGPGLSPGDQAKLFGRFARGSAIPTGGESSTGLGLSIVKLMIEEIGGRTWAENRTDRKGSRFFAEFPRY